MVHVLPKLAMQMDRQVAFFTSKDHSEGSAKIAL